MFTGIVQEIGTIETLETRGDWTVCISASFSLDALRIGTSVACDGICLTVADKNEKGFLAQLSAETLDRTTARWWRAGGLVNIERSLRLGDEMAGHMVSGHVDGVVKIVAKEDEGESFRYRLEAPAEFAPFLAPKGSIALDGISLTINDVEGSCFGVNIVPHTQKETTMGAKEVGHLMNFEVDMIARYVDRLLAARSLKS